MELITDLLILASLLGYAVAFPLQLNETTNGTGASKEVEKDIFSLIIEANKGIRVPLKDIDIYLPAERNAVNCQDRKCFWPGSSEGRVPVPYVLSSVYDNGDRATFSAAFQEYATMTCVDFVNRTKETDYLNIVSENGCWSSIGRVGKAQSMSLSRSACIKQGIIEHELMHNLGFHHEHSRPDRDTYIDILWKNLKAGSEGNLGIDTNGNTLDLLYDYNSVMHYSRTAMSKNDQDTIIPKPNPNVPIGQRYGLSNLDVSKINKLYNCNLCRTLFTDPSGSITVTPSTSLLPNGGSCIWLIRIPSKKVSLLLSDFNIESSSDCQSNHLTVYDGRSKTSPIIMNKKCGQSQGQGLSVRSSGNNMLVEFVFSGPIGSQYFNATYRTVS